MQSSSCRFVRWSLCLLLLLSCIDAATEEVAAPGENSLSVDWLVRLGGAGPEILHSLDADAEGNVTIGGVFADTLKTDAGTLKSHAAGEDGFVARLDPEGTVVWARGFGGDRSDTLTWVTAVPGGSAYATGQFSASASFDPGVEGDVLEPVGLPDIFLLKVGCDGNPEWAKNFGGKFGDVGKVLVPATDGGAYLGAHFQLTAMFGDADHSLTSRGNIDVALLQVEGDGRVRWLRQLGGEGIDTLTDATAVGADGLVAAGTFQSSAAIDEIELESAGSSDIFVLRLDEKGGTRWVRSFGNEKSDNPGKVAAGPDGSVVFSGSLQGSWQLDDSSVESAGAADLAVLKWGPDGVLQWARRFGAAESETTEAVDVGPDGRIYIAGSFSGETRVGDFEAVSSDSDAFIAVLEADGEAAGLYPFPARGVERILGMKVIAPGEVVIGGIFANEMIVAGERVESRGKNDIFLARLRLPKG